MPTFIEPSRGPVKRLTILANLWRARESLKVFRDYANVVGGDWGFDAAGFVQIVGPVHAEAMAANVAMQQRIGIDAHLVSTDQLRGISPGMRVDDIGAAAYEPGSGFADPNATTFAFAEAARRLGGHDHDEPRWPPHHRPGPLGARLFVMLGDSGTSFEAAPAIGRCLAEWIVKGRPETADLSRFRSTRFAEGALWMDPTGYGIERLTISR